MAKLFSEAAKLRNNIEGCVRAAPALMSQREVFEWPSVKELAGPHGFKKVEYAIIQLAREGRLVRERMGREVYVKPGAVKPLTVAPASAGQPVDVEVDKMTGAVVIRVKGVEIRITVKGD